METRENRMGNDRTESRNYQKQCYFCTNNIKYIDYKDLDLITKFLDPYAKILNHRRSGLCAGHQRELGNAIKRSRFLALLPFIAR